jgi:peroxiredoxin
MKSPAFRSLTVIAAVLAAFYLWYCSRQPRYVAGEEAADFQTTLADGRSMRLADLRGQHVLLQFWGSWCGPCRAENPELVALYRKYHPRGFEILSIALEASPRAWQNAIRQDGLPWSLHAMESAEFDGPVAKQYNIHSIPSTFLINPEGTIIGVDLHPEQMDRLLADRLP